jgi:DNA-binding IclR family transcriptional regulator
VAEPQIPDEVLNVLRAVRERQLDGYSLLSRTGLTPEKLTDALQKLVDRGLVSVKGELRADSVGETLVAVPPDAMGDVDAIVSPYKTRSRMRSAW